MLSIALVVLGTTVRAQDVDAALGSSTGWQRYDWLKPSDDSTTTPNGSKLTASVGQDISDPFTTVSNGSIWQEKYGATYTQPVVQSLALSYETDAVTLNENSNSYSAPTEGLADDLAHGQKVALQFQPISQLTLTGNVHDALTDPGAPSTSMATRGSGFTAETQLPFNSVLTLGTNSDNDTYGQLGPAAVADNSYDAQFKQPLGKLPFTAVFKGHYEETTSEGALQTRLPSLEQSLVWKPADSTTLQMGLRQQHYENFPGVTNQLNEAVFADWSQTLLPDVTWHSYAEVLDSHNMDMAPAAPTTTGANGTAQSADPTNSLVPTGAFTDQTVTFSTGPSFKLDRDVSASIEYSNRVDRNPLPGEVGQEQRVSVSLKSSF